MSLDTILDLSPLKVLYREHVEALNHSYAEVLKKHGLDAVVLHTGSLQKKSVFDDQYWPLVMVPHTRHWAPLDIADCAIVVEPGKKPRILLNTERGFWDAVPELATGHFWLQFETTEVKDAQSIKALLPRGRTAFVGEDKARAASWGFSDEQTAPKALLDDLDELRVRKSEYEVWCLREANRRAAAGHQAVIQAFLDGDRTELELHLEYLRATGQDDPETPYKNIVALGEHAATLHHVGYGKRITAAQSLLLDAGASFAGYDSDITRTVCKGQGSAKDAFSHLVAEVEKLQQELCARAKVGLPYEQLHNQSHELLAGALKAVGIAKPGASVEELVDSGATRKFLPHGLGHSLGIQTHDVGCRRIAPEVRNPFLRNTTTVAAGQVFTIEPGCYFIRMLLDELRPMPVAQHIDWRTVDALVPFGGVRIEDDLFVIDGGSENLTRSFLPGAGA